MLAVSRHNKIHFMEILSIHRNSFHYMRKDVVVLRMLFYLMFLPIIVLYLEFLVIYFTVMLPITGNTFIWCYLLAWLPLLGSSFLRRSTLEGGRRSSGCRYLPFEIRTNVIARRALNYWLFICIPVAITFCLSPWLLARWRGGERGI